MEMKTKKGESITTLPYFKQSIYCYFLLKVSLNILWHSIPTIEAAGEKIIVYPFSSNVSISMKFIVPSFVSLEASELDLK